MARRLQRLVTTASTRPEYFSFMEGVWIICIHSGNLLAPSLLSNKQKLQWFIT